MDPDHPYERVFGVVTGGGDNEWAAVEITVHARTKAGEFSTSKEEQRTKKETKTKRIFSALAMKVTETGVLGGEGIESLFSSLSSISFHFSSPKE